MGFISQQDKHLQSLMFMKYYIYKYTLNICTLFSKSWKFPCSITHTVFQAGCYKDRAHLPKVTLTANLSGWMRSWSSPGPPAQSSLISAAGSTAHDGAVSHPVRPWLLAGKACNSWGGKPPLDARGTKRNDSWQDAEQGFFVHSAFSIGLQSQRLNS